MYPSSSSPVHEDREVGLAYQFKNIKGTNAHRAPRPVPQKQRRWNQEWPRYLKFRKQGFKVLHKFTSRKNRRFVKPPVALCAQDKTASSIGGTDYIRAHATHRESVNAVEANSEEPVNVGTVLCLSADCSNPEHLLAALTRPRLHRDCTCDLELIGDSGATGNMMPCSGKLHNLRRAGGQIFLGDRSQLQIEAIGDSQLKFINDVLVCPSLLDCCL